jgi:hypothetical protein
MSDLWKVSLAACLLLEAGCTGAGTGAIHGATGAPLAPGDNSTAYSIGQILAPIISAAVAYGTSYLVHGRDKAPADKP